MGDADTGLRGGLMPPHLILQHFLPADDAAQFLAYAIAHRDIFKPTKTGVAEKGAVREHIRNSVGTRKLGPFTEILSAALHKRLPELFAGAGIAPFLPDGLDLQCVAHGDGGFYKRHIGTQTVESVEQLRVLTGVYYLHRAPKAYTGGGLRLYAIGNPSGHLFTDIEAAHNTLVVFPAFAPHEVLPVHCPSNDDVDARYSVNCWFYRKRANPKSV
jgi:hypothetical protein